MSDFSHPDDGWYQIEAIGTFPNGTAGITQVIDRAAVDSIVSNFNAQANKPGFPGMLIDHEHFRHDPDKETTAYGWLEELQARSDGIYGQIRWTATGRKAVDGGEYRFFSSEFLLSDMEPVNGDKKRLRPLKLSGLSLTNVPNNAQGQKPITNREPMTTTTTDPSAATDAANALSEDASTPGEHRAAAAAHERAALANTTAADESDNPRDKTTYNQAATGHRLQAAQHREGLKGSVSRGPANNGPINDGPANDGPASNGPVTVSNDDEDALQNRAAASGEARMLATQQARASGCSFEQAWNSVRRARPELFGLVENRCQSDPRRSATARAFNRVLNEATTVENREFHYTEAEPMDLHDRVLDYQRQHGIRTFAQAWERAARAGILS